MATDSLSQLPVGVFRVYTVSPSVACCPRTPLDEPMQVYVDLEPLGHRYKRLECAELQVSGPWCYPIEHMFDGTRIERLPGEPDVPAVCRRCNAFFGMKEQATRTSTLRRRRTPARCRVCQSSWQPGTHTSRTASSQVSRWPSLLTTL